MHVTSASRRLLTILPEQSLTTEGGLIVICLPGHDATAIPLLVNTSGDLPWVGQQVYSASPPARGFHIARIPTVAKLLDD